MATRGVKKTAPGVRSQYLHVKKGDKVIVISGKDKGVTGTVLQAYPTRNKVLVEGVNRVKKHTRVNSSNRGSKSGGVVTQEAPIHVSNVMVAVDIDGKTVGSRVGYRFDNDGKKVRIAKRTGAEIDG